MAIFWKWPRQPGFRLVTRIFKGGACHVWGVEAFFVALTNIFDKIKWYFVIWFAL